MVGNTKEIIDYLFEQGDRDKVWEIEEHQERPKKRTLSSNAYYWVLIAKVAQKLRTSTNFVHNTMLREHNEPFIVDGKIARVTLPNTEETENTVLEAMTYHLKPTSQVWTGKDGVEYRTYTMLRGSHDLTQSSFSALLDALIVKAKEMDIEVLSDDELAHIRALEASRAKD